MDMGAVGDETHPAFAPPYLRDNDVVIGQSALILHYLGPKLDLVASDEVSRLWTLQIQLTIADFVYEAHDTHHPLGVSEYYENQKPEAAKRSEDFRAHRVPKFFDWFDDILSRNPAGDTHLVGAQLSYVDLSLFQVIAGLNYAFPKMMGRVLPTYPRLEALHALVGALPALRDYLRSERRLAFNEDGIFRHYPELDL